MRTVHFLDCFIILFDQFTMRFIFFLRTKILGTNVKINSEFVRVTKLVNSIRIKNFLYMCTIGRSNKHFVFSSRSLELIESAV